MTAVLVTGMSGVGKSTALAELAARGFETVDTDYNGWIRVVDGERLWDEPRISRLLTTPRTGPLFVQGTVANQGRFYDRFAAVALLSVPLEVALQRLELRSSNAFGKSDSERGQIVRDFSAVEPLLRAGATHQIDATRTLSDIVDELIAIAGK